MTSTWDVPDDILSAHKFELALVAIARQQELIGENEMLAWYSPDSRRDTLNELRRLRGDLATAPGLWAIHIWTLRWTQETVAMQRSLGAAHQAWLAGQITIAGWQVGFFEQWLEEAKSLDQLWDDLDTVLGANRVRNKRLALKRLREALGEKAFLVGDMPPPIPLWRYRQIP